MKKVGRVVADVLEAMRRAIRPGLTTGELDAIAARRLAFHGARSAPRDGVSVSWLHVHQRQRGDRPRHPG